ncbi:MULTISPECIES: molecular chaperone DnaJ [unclassified Anabaena]|uniref:molecular chaperone DnaJ n=1 Tax=unclassified Anabaena TaxID=2619674 RepID=UPI0006AC9350|nr:MULTISPECIES: molecular chaperone DnaJ [unclassified Anabaena]ALB43687.1 molecular chaperone DnaJ [Anabaena sp. WA102]OBQ22876.1 MAG: molecular chaperone DnaJ [Anabaena sp. AL93]
MRTLAPEEEELEKKKTELTGLETELAQRELDLTTLQAELHAFEREYFRVIGIRYTELDRIEDQIAEYMASLEAVKAFKQSQSLKQLYRDVAKCIHPDLATDEKERLRRQELMAQVNQAYENGDEEKIREILQSWENSPESIRGEGVAAELVRTIRKIAQGKQRLNTIFMEIDLLEKTELYQLKSSVNMAEKSGRNLLSEMANQLDEQILIAQHKLDELKTQLGLYK